MGARSAAQRVPVRSDRPVRFCGSEDAAVERFKLADGVRTVLNGGHETWVQALAFSKDGSIAMSGGCDGKIYVVGYGRRRAQANSHRPGPQGLDPRARRQPRRHAAGQRRQR